MRIAQFISHFLYQAQFDDPNWAKDYICSGGEHAAYHLVKNLARLGHEVSVFTSSKDRQDSVESYDGITIYRYGSVGQIGLTKFSPKLFWKPIELLKNVDIIHIHHTTPPGGMAGLACNSRLKKPLLVTHHGFERQDHYGSFIRRSAVFLSANYYVDYLLRKANAILCISPTYINDSRFLKNYPQKVFSIPNGVNIEDYGTDRTKAECRQLLNLPQENPLVLYVGSFMQFKGVDYLVDAMRLVTAEIPDALTILVGRGPEQEQIKIQQKVKSLGLESLFRFEGFIARSEVKSFYYHAADVLVIPSTTEMFPLVLLEAAASGCPIVLSDLETFHSIIKDHETGIFVLVGKPESIAAGIIEVLGSKALQSKLSQSVKELSRQYSWYEIAKETVNLYQTLL